MDKGPSIGELYIDLSKAFDTISHTSTVNKLPSYGIIGISQQSFTSYLLSSPYPINCRVPQGSILSFLLFLLHFEDSTLILTLCFNFDTYLLALCFNVTSSFDYIIVSTFYVTEICTNYFYDNSF